MKYERNRLYYLFYWTDLWDLCLKSKKEIVIVDFRSSNWVKCGVYPALLPPNCSDQSIFNRAHIYMDSMLWCIMNFPFRIKTYSRYTPPLKIGQCRTLAYWLNMIERPNWSNSVLKENRDAHRIKRRRRNKKMKPSRKWGPIDDLLCSRSV